jgi:hypothetical protein
VKAAKMRGEIFEHVHNRPPEPYPRAEHNPLSIL